MRISLFLQKGADKCQKVIASYIDLEIHVLNFRLLTSLDSRISVRRGVVVAKNVKSFMHLGG